MSNTLADENTRKEALDISRSFITQAPAGSGKTELLTQRMLGLIANVNKAPEQVLAITFTRKAAAEMRSRVLNALIKAANEPEPDEPHQRTTWQLAKRVLERDKKENWGLIEQPNRLRILTIDGLCSRIARQSPMQSRFGGHPNVADDPNPLYQAATQALFLSLNEEAHWTQSLKKMLLHVDNHVGWLETLFIRLLSRRDQWLGYVLRQLTSRDVDRHTRGGDQNQITQRAQLEAALQTAIKDALYHCANNLPETLMSELIILCNFAAKNLKLQHQFDAIPEKDLEDLLSWQFIASILLRADGEWRKQVTKVTGFPAPSSEKAKIDKDYLKDMKNRMHAFLEELNNHEAFRLALTEIQHLPPTHYSEQQWDMVSALIDVLPILVAHLQLEFQENNTVDYIEISNAALTALGTDDEPTDLALNWDYRIEHILVDEFQDTSITQFSLLEKLMQGWVPGDGRTLFLVGDPMQSIYRFREAEVGLFLRARHHGIGGIELNYLQLQTNFRSQACIVHWVNGAFSKIFPESEDVSLGAVPFHHSTLPPLKVKEPSSPNSLLPFGGEVPKAEGGYHPHFLLNADDQHEASAIVNLIKQKQSSYPDETIAILVRSRTHLSGIIPLLQQSNLRFQANEIEGLVHRMVIRDLLSLTKALWHLGDRLAWLSILRAPWCGLTLKDLHCIAKDHEGIICEKLQNIEDLEFLSSDAKERVNHFVSIMNDAILKIRRFPFHKCVKETWYQLNGPACVEDESDLENAERFFELIKTLEEGGDLKQITELERRIKTLYANPDPLSDDRLQIMSIHKAKGLEFDTVIIPGMAKRSGVEQPTLLTWLERPRETGHADLILAPIKHAAEDYDSIYQYCHRVDSQKAELEMVRLLYVATTRAKKELHLFGCLETDEDGEVVVPKKKSFLGYLWPVVGDEFEEHLPTRGDSGSTSEALMRLSLSGMTGVRQLETSRNMIRDLREAAPDFLDSRVRENYVSAHIGTLIHEILYQISLEGVDNYPLEKIKTQTPFWRIRLLELGLFENQLNDALQKVQKAIKNTLADERGRWILSDHKDAKSEYPISTIINGHSINMILDRTFIDESNVRWVIDYKTGMLDQESHRNQLAIYVSAMEKVEKRAIKCCLYYPLIPSEIIF